VLEVLDPNALGRRLRSGCELLDVRAEGPERAARIEVPANSLNLEWTWSLALMARVYASEHRAVERARAAAILCAREAALLLRGATHRRDCIGSADP
jgi:hypothetical protein